MVQIGRSKKMEQGLFKSSNIEKWIAEGRGRNRWNPGMNRRDGWFDAMSYLFESAAGVKAIFEVSVGEGRLQKAKWPGKVSGLGHLHWFRSRTSNWRRSTRDGDRLVTYPRLITGERKAVEIMETVR
jgi:hypothetical protein